MIAALGLLLGIIAGLAFAPDVPLSLQNYLPIAVVAALDAVFGGLRAYLDGIFDDKVFVVSFVSNVVVAAAIVYLGDQLGVGSQLSTGVVVVLGPTGRNFAAGMSGGYAFVLDLDVARVNPELVELAPVTGKAADELRSLVEQHAEETGSEIASALLADWDSSLARFTEVMPSDFKRVLEAREEALEEGLDEDEANARIMEVLHG